jgi:hypothetical protein
MILRLRIDCHDMLLDPALDGRWIEQDLAAEPDVGDLPTLD